MKPFAICASGPSMTKGACDAIRAAGIQAIVINDTWKLMPDAYALLADDRWWKRNAPKPAEFKGLRLQGRRLGCAGERTSLATYIDPVELPHGGAGGNNALHATNFAAKTLGADPILLFGVDLRDDDLSHWHGPHEGLNNPSRPTFVRARRAWELYAGREHPRIINCNTQSALTCFERMPMDEALRQCETMPA